MGELLIFHHIPKTGGSSLLRVLQRNYGRHLLSLYGPERRSTEWYRKLVQGWSARKRSSIECIAAHSSQFLIPVLDSPWRVITLVRDPVHRVLSLYDFAKQQARAGEAGGAGKLGRAVLDLGWGIEDVYRNLANGDETTSDLHRLFKPFFDGQTRTILAPHTPVRGLPFGSPGAQDRDHWRDHALEILERHYTVGVSERHADSLALFAREFGWREAFVAWENVTPGRESRAAIPEEIVSLIRGFHPIDGEIHALYEHRLMKATETT